MEEWLKENWLVFVPILISLVSLVISIMSYKNSLKQKMLNNQPLIEITTIYEIENNLDDPYLDIMLNNLNKKAFHIYSVSVKNKKTKFECKYEKYPPRGPYSESTEPREDRISLRVYFPERHNMNESVSIHYKDFEGSKRTLMTENIHLVEGKPINRLNGSGLILK